MKLQATNIKDKNQFRMDEYTLTKYRDYGNNYYLYKMTNPKGRHCGWELVKGKKHTQPDGEVIYIYPSISDWGLNGWSYPASMTEEQILRRAGLSTE